MGKTRCARSLCAQMHPLLSTPQKPQIENLRNNRQNRNDRQRLPGPHNLPRQLFVLHFTKGTCVCSMLTAIA